MMDTINVEGKKVRITNPEKLLWEEYGIRKIDYLKVLIELAPYILPYTKDRLLTTIRYPDGVNGKSFYQKQVPDYAPDWLDVHDFNHTLYLNLKDTATLLWLGNQAALELHTTFNQYQNPNHPTSLVFDLDPSKGQVFEEVVEVALLIHSILEKLNIPSFVKTSGATGLQIFIPIGTQYDYNAARKISEFFAVYFSQKYPDKITIERIVNNRGRKLYFDYLQMWQSKTIISAYSPRATNFATVSTPIEWDELENGITAEDFTLLTISHRLKEMKDIFSPILYEENQVDLDFILERI